MERAKRIYRYINPVHYIPILVYLVVYLIWFGALETTPNEMTHIVTVPIDYRIPFVPSFVVPYFSWFVFVPFWAACLYYWDRESYDRTTTGLMIGMTVFLIVSTVWPNGQDLRVNGLKDTGLFTHLILGIWGTDTPTNVFPSMHVFNTLTIWIGVMRTKSRRLKQKKVRIGITVWGALICLSTVLIKQHSILDGIGACILALILYVPVFQKNFYLKFLIFRSKKDLDLEKMEKAARQP